MRFDALLDNHDHDRSDRIYLRWLVTFRRKSDQHQKLDLECREMYIDVSNVSISFEENKEQHTNFK